MPTDTLQEAIQRELQQGLVPMKEVVPGENVYALVRDPHLYRQPFLSTYATIVGEAKNGKVQVYLYAAGSEKRVVPREALFTRESDWCRGEPIASVCHSRTHLWGMIYHERREYTRIYPLETQEGPGENVELAEEQVLADFLRTPLSFQEEEPGHVFHKELRIVAHRGPLHCIRAEAFLHRDWKERYTGGYFMLADGRAREQFLGTHCAELRYVSTFLQRKTLYFAVRDAPDVFFIDRDFKQASKREKSRDYYLIHGDKIYEVRKCWESQLCAYLSGDLSLEDLFRYAIAVGGEGDE